MLYKSERHAARAFARRYMKSLGGGWFRFGRRNLQGLHLVWHLMRQRGYALPWSDGRIEMHFDILDHCVGRNLR